jgi:putative intracellular protease/amidase
VASRGRHQSRLPPRSRVPKLVERTRPVDEIDVDTFDAIVVVGGQGPMFTFDTATNLHAKFDEFTRPAK